MKNKSYTFRVVIDTEEDIFRDIVILGNQNFEELHHSIIAAFGFEGDQMASFYMSNEEWDKGEEIGLMDMSFDDNNGPASMKKTLVDDKVNMSHQKILYVYDFLKMWIFYIELIDEGVENEDDGYPYVKLSFGEAPEESSKIIPDLAENMFDETTIEDDINDVFNEFENDDFESFENIDDFDI